MNTSERAEQLADAIGVSTWGIPRNRAIEKILAFAADSANLARGLAIEQAAQRVRLAKRSDGSGRGTGDHPVLIDPELAAEAIESLASADAAQALAAHDAEKFEEGAQHATRIIMSETESHDAEIERRARLDARLDEYLFVAQMISEKPGWITRRVAELNRQKAALAESQPDRLVTCDYQHIPHRQSDSEIPCKNPQPAPATKPGTYLPCTWLSCARGGMGYCSCGNFGSRSEMVPYPAWETHAADGPVPAKGDSK